ncbi:MAG: thiamine-phosphate kinase [Hyphomicrobiaceae bacterium]|nr:thiamine-phosphate kinase [Hyphomicrobiaceae bacterium]
MTEAAPVAPIGPPTNPIGGEEDIIQRYLVPLTCGGTAGSAQGGAFGLRDDAALILAPHGVPPGLVMTMDAVAEGVHFLPHDPPADIGWKALAVNVSDLIAKGASPVTYLMALSFPEAPTQEWLGGFTAGLADAQAAFGITLVGGDTDRRPGPITVTITAVGALQPGGRFVPRTAARQGLALYVSGTLGDAALGLALRRGESRAGGWSLDPSGREALERRYLRPAPPLALAALLPTYAVAAMDISDGLAKDLSRMVQASGVSATVDASRLPLSAGVAAALARDPSVMRDVLSGGDDYQVLCAVEPERGGAFERAATKVGVQVTRIGQTAAGSGVSIRDANGQPIELARRGWDHF